MKAKLFVVNETTLEEAKREKIAKIKIPLASKEKEQNGEIIEEETKKPTKQFVQSTDSMLADFLQLSLGDYVFFWCEKKKQSQSSSITGVYRIISKPYFHFDSSDDLFPFKVRIEEAFVFEKPVNEYEVLNSPFINNALWNIVGKKISGKGRGSIQLTPRECESLLQLLIKNNPNYTFIPEDSNRFDQTQSQATLSVDYTKKGEKLNPPLVNHIHEYNMNSFVHFDKKGKLHFEKSYEAIFNFEINRKNGQFLKQIGIDDCDDIVWFGNYLPYSLDSTEMDYLIFTSRDKINITGAYVLEFKRDNLPLPDKDTHFRRSLQYSKWVDENLLSGANITRPILICEKCPDFNSDKLNEKDKNIVKAYNELEERILTQFNFEKRVSIFASDFSGDAPVFNQKR